MLVLHRTLAKVAAFARKESGTRWVVTGVLIEHDVEGGTFTAVATDTKQLLVVTGKDVGCKAYPEIGAFKKAGDSKTSALIPAEAWTDAFTQAAKLKGTKTCKDYVAIKMDTEVTFFATNGEKDVMQAGRPVEGRFPPYMDIVPRKKPCFSIAFDPCLLSDALKNIASIMPGDGRVCKRVNLNFWTSAKPMTITAECEDGTKITGLIMPLAGDGNGETFKDGADAALTEAQEELRLARIELRASNTIIEDLRQEIAILKQRRGSDA